MSTALIGKANDNFRAAFVKSARHARNGDCVQFGPITATASGTSIPAFNQMFALQSAPRTEIERAIAWMEGRDVPFWLTVTDDTRGEVTSFAETLNLVDAESSQPGMALTPLDSIPQSSSPATITPVTMKMSFGRSPRFSRRCSMFRWRSRRTSLPSPS